jgi:hypothetical protein
MQASVKLGLAFAATVFAASAYAGQSVKAASMDAVTEKSSQGVPMAPNVAKTPATPGAPVPIPYPNVTPPADTPVQVKVPTPTPAPAWPSKIEGIGIKQQPVKAAPANVQRPAIIYQTPAIRR